jgi:glutathione S-transferase
VIVQYLEDRYAPPSTLPVEVAERAHARWLEECADTIGGDTPRPGSMR